MIRPADLISPAYVEMQRTLHADPAGYGERGDKWAGIVLQLAIEYEAGSILDYGCGSGSLAKAIRPLNGFRIAEYDPAIPGKDGLPMFADLVVCTDVLEHIEKDRLDTVLEHIKMLARKALWVVVATQQSHKRLSDGRRAHLTTKPAAWWKQKVIKAGFTLHNPPTVVRSVPEKEWSVVLTP